MSPSRPLTHDEKKAAEAAFQGQAFNAAWSQSALAVYQGILKARGCTEDAINAMQTHREPAPTSAGAESGVSEAAHQTVSSDAGRGRTGASVRYITSRQEAIDAGLLVDVTRKAECVGLHLAVAMTKAVWERNILMSPETDPDERDLRLRDMLLAVRLRLAGLETPVPWIEVPVLFPSPGGDEDPDVFSVYALFHKDPVAAGCLTLIHPKELSMIRPSSQSDTDEDPSSNELP